MALIDTVKPWFETGDFPTQAQFWFWMESLRWNDQPLEISDIINLQNIINQMANPIQVFVTESTDPFEYTIPEDFLLEKILLKPMSDTSAFCTSDGGDPGDIVPEDVDNLITSARGGVWDVNQMAIGSERKIYVEGLPVGSTIVFIKRKTIL